MKHDVSLFIISASLVLGCLVAMDSIAAESNDIERVKEMAESQLSQHFQNAKAVIEVSAIEQSLNQDEGIKRIEFISENSRGLARFKVIADSGNNEVSMPFTAVQSAFIARKRILPTEKLDKNNFVVQDIEISKGMAREYRGLILPVSTDLSKLESRQTFIEGQFLTLSGVQKIPDIKRGSVVKLRILAPGLDLTTTAVADESGSIDDQIHVTTQKSKKQMLGRISADHSIEVFL